MQCVVCLYVTSQSSRSSLFSFYVLNLLLLLDYKLPLLQTDILSVTLYSIQVKQKLIKMEWVATAEQIADIHTKRQ